MPVETHTERLYSCVHTPRRCWLQVVEADRVTLLPFIGQRDCLVLRLVLVGLNGPYIQHDRNIGQEAGEDAGSGRKQLQILKRYAIQIRDSLSHGVDVFVKLISREIRPSAGDALEFAQLAKAEETWTLIHRTSYCICTGISCFVGF